MYGWQGEYENGTRQNLGPTVFGQRIKEQCTGVMDAMIKRGNVVEDRNDRCRNKTAASVCKYGLHDYEGPGQLNIELEDMIFVARKDVPGGVCQLQDPNMFASFNGLPLFDTPHDYRLRYRFMGFARSAFAFDNDCQGKGFTLGVAGIYNFINHTDDTLKPNDPLTWEPDFSDFTVATGFKSKRQNSGGSSVVKGRFVRYEPITMPSTYAGVLAKLQDLYPSLKTWLTKPQHTAAEQDVIVDLACGIAMGRHIVGHCMECTQPNQWGRVRLCC